MDAKIKKIVLDLGNKEITLTCEQAKMLKELLDELFEREVVKEVHHHDYGWCYPIPIYEYPKPSLQPWIVTCGTGQAQFSGNDVTLSLMG